MESAAKRKAGGATAVESEGRPSKRQKVPVRAPCPGVCSNGGGRDERQNGLRRFAMRAMREGWWRGARDGLVRPATYTSPRHNAATNTSPAAMRTENSREGERRGGAMDNADDGRVPIGDTQ